MKKKLLNLSLFMLLSTSSNVFAMLKEGTNAYLVLEGPVKEVTEKLNQATVEIVTDCASGAAQTKLNQAVEALSNLDDSKLTQISEAVKSGLAKSYNVLTGLLPSRESQIIQSVLDKSTNLKNIIVDFARSNPKTSGAIAVTGAGLCAFGLYNQRLKNKNVEIDTNKQPTRAILANDDESSSGGEAAAEHELPTQQTPAVSLLSSQDSQDYKQFIDYLIKNDLENDLLAYNHVDNDKRTLLMLLAENYWPSGIVTTNYPALQYFKQAIENHNAEQGENPKYIDVDKEDNHGRTALFYAAFYGLENIVNFLIDELNASVTQKDIDAASYKDGFDVKQETWDKIKQKLQTKCC